MTFSVCHELNPSNGHDSSSVSQSDYPSATRASQVPIQRVARVHNQRVQRRDPAVIELAVVRDYHDAVCGANLFVSEVNRRKRRAIAFGVGIVKSQLADKRIVIAHIASLASQPIDN